MLIVALSFPVPAAAQEEAQFDVGAQLTGAFSSEFDSGDIGIGARVAWYPTSLVGVEAELDVYPRDFPDEPAFSSSRVEGLFGVTIGPPMGSVRPFVRLRPGFLTFSEAPEPIACILIFPPPLACTLADGRTVFAFDVGGGLEWRSTGRTFVRFDAGDRILRYPGPAIDESGDVRDDSFLSHDFRFSVGAGVRF